MLPLSKTAVFSASLTLAALTAGVSFWQLSKHNHPRASSNSRRHRRSHSSKRSSQQNALKRDTALFHTSSHPSSGVPPLNLKGGDHIGICIWVPTASAQGMLVAQMPNLLQAFRSPQLPLAESSISLPPTSESHLDASTGSSHYGTPLTVPIGDNLGFIEDDDSLSVCEPTTPSPIISPWTFSPGGSPVYDEPPYSGRMTRIATPISSPPSSTSPEAWLSLSMRQSSMPSPILSPLALTPDLSSSEDDLSATCSPLSPGTMSLQILNRPMPSNPHSVFSPMEMSLPLNSASISRFRRYGGSVLDFARTLLFTPLNQGILLKTISDIRYDLSNDHLQITASTPDVGTAEADQEIIDDINLRLMTTRPLKGMTIDFTHDNHDPDYPIDTTYSFELFNSILTALAHKATTPHTLRLCLPTSFRGSVPFRNALGLVISDASVVNGYAAVQLPLLPQSCEQLFAGPLVVSWWLNPAIDLSQLVTLKLQYPLPVNDCLQLLSLCPNVQELDLGWLVSSVQSQERQPSKYTQLVKLFSLKVSSSVDLSQFFWALSLPGLRKLAMDIASPTAPYRYNINWEVLDNLDVRCISDEGCESKLAALCRDNAILHFSSRQ
ncbi:hypothetical protein HGRIS_000888 [Hohenbuehelia grisea]|uniref:Uncharacterized protein n=1 Tax=Hohenbuehelia grisea TaxID=104357 RepID=A0ABR3IQ30_9AGAR